MLLPKDEGVFHGVQEVDGVRGAHPVQIYVHLKGQRRMSERSSCDLGGRRSSESNVSREPLRFVIGHARPGQSRLLGHAEVLFPTYRCLSPLWRRGACCMVDVFCAMMQSEKTRGKDH